MSVGNLFRAPIKVGRITPKQLTNVHSLECSDASFLWAIYVIPKIDCKIVLIVSVSEGDCSLSVYSIYYYQHQYFYYDGHMVKSPKHVACQNKSTIYVNLLSLINPNGVQKGCLFQRHY